MKLLPIIIPLVLITLTKCNSSDNSRSTKEPIFIPAETAENYFQNGNEALKDKKYSQALEWYKKAIRKSPKSEGIYINMALAYYYLKKYKTAINYFNHAIRINKNNDTAYFNKGLVYQRMHKYKNAIRSFTKAIRYNPTSAIAYFHRGLIFLEYLKQYNRSIKDFTKVIKLNAFLKDIYYYRGLTYFLLKDCSRSIQDFTRHISLSKRNNEQTYTMRAKCYSSQMDFQNALKDIQKAIQINPENIDHYYTRGLIYFILKKCEGIKDLQKYLNEKKIISKKQKDLIQKIISILKKQCK